MQQARRSHPSRAFAVAAVLLILSGPVYADPDDEVRNEPVRKLTGKKVFAELDPDLDPLTKNWFRANIRPVEKHGFEYRHTFSQTAHDRDLIFSIQGPLISNKTPGLAFEIRF